MTEPVGLLVLDKPAGITSHDVVARARRALGLRRVGHAGTLDPPATGVLLVGVGRATRLLRFLQGADKAYEGTLVLGATTTTLDATGETTGTFEMSGVTEEEVAAAAAALTGDLDQVPPMVSAVHVDGRRLHELAREGIEVERAPRRVHVKRFDVAALGEGRYRFEVVCGSGTYVRSLVDDLGRTLGGGAHLAVLRRTRVGAFRIDEAAGLEELEERGAALLRTPAQMVADLASLRVGAGAVADVLHGRAISAPGTVSAGPVAVLGPDGALVAVCAPHRDGTLRPEVVVATHGAADADD